MNEGTAVLTNDDFLGRVENTRSEIRQLTSNVAEIGTIHQRVLGSPDNSSSAQLENLVAQTQILNTRIKDQIKFLEMDAAKSLRNGSKNTTKDSQVRTLRNNFKSQLEDYEREEQLYRQRYQEQIARQYRIVNPEASDAEVREAAEADWGDEGVFQTAVRRIFRRNICESCTNLLKRSSNPIVPAQLRVFLVLCELVTMISRTSKRHLLS